MVKIMKTPYFSYKLHALPKGCQLCVRGLKTVLLITGKCSNNCFYCPISDQKKNKDVVYINEWPSKNIVDCISEIKLCNSQGIGITGGDPLIELGRTIHYIKTLKKRFKKEFHIHLYTPLNLVTKEALADIHKAGLDEIRFHPDISNPRLWSKINLATNFDWDIGVEIPAIPDKKQQTIKLIHFINNINVALKKPKISFLNINELEISDSNASQLLRFNFKPKNRISYGIKGSEQLALQMLNYVKLNKIRLNVHYCTTTLKDRVQLANRIKRRAKNIKQKFDILTSEGILIRGAIYFPGLEPTFGYHHKISQVQNNPLKLKKILTELLKIKNRLKTVCKIPPDIIQIDKKKLRILTSPLILQAIKDEVQMLKPAIIHEYPTHDSLIVELEWL